MEDSKKTPAPSHISMGDLVPRSELERLESLHRSEIADMAERFRSVNVEKAMEQLAKSLPVAPVQPVVPSADEIDALIERLLDAQQDINLSANETMSQPLCDASALIDEVEKMLLRIRALSAVEGSEG